MKLDLENSMDAIKLIEIKWKIALISNYVKVMLIIKWKKGLIFCIHFLFWLFIKALFILLSGRNTFNYYDRGNLLQIEIVVELMGINEVNIKDEEFDISMVMMTVCHAK